MTNNIKRRDYLEELDVERR